ncbi:MAG TPA: response regulator, partial [Polyangiales bacterium]
MDRSAQTALGSARARFVEGLPRRARELHEAVEHLGSARGDPQVHEEMRRRLHALYATAQVFEEDGLAHAVKDVIAWLDAARDAGRNLDAAGLARLRAFAERLPDYVSDELAQRPSRAQPVADAAEARCAAGSASLPPAQPSAAAVEPDADRPSAITRSVSGFVSTPAVTGVLVVDSAPMRARLRQILPEDQFEVWGTDDAEEAIRLLHVDSPDFAFVSGELAALPGVDLVRRLQTDPLSNVRAVYMLLPEGASYDAQFLRQTGADGVLIAPFDEAAVVALVRARTHFVRRAFGALSTLTHGTADDVAARVADEIRRGIADSLQAGRSEKIHFDDASELMAAAWSAIGRVRAHLVEHSRGRIRFRADALGDAPALLALGEQSVAPEPDAQLGSVLQGRRVLVADDDPAVLWFFAGLLREAGAQVLEATDGRQALELARLKRPDVVVSDILMPKIDGFAL